MFERSILENQAALDMLLAGAFFRTFSYPISPPRPHTKRMRGPRFACARGGGQTFNVGKTDLNYLARTSWRKPARSRRHQARDRRQPRRAWMADLRDSRRLQHPDAIRMHPGFFEDIVECSVRSGARIVPVAEALDSLRAPPPS